MTGRFIGVGITHNAARPELPAAAAHARQLGDLLGRADDFDTDDIFGDLTDFELVTDAIARSGTAPPDRLVVFWAGHGEGGGNLGDLELLLSHHTDQARRVRSATDLLKACARSGAGQLLLILDTCHSGSVLKDVAAIATDLEQYRPAGRGWLGVLVAAGQHEQAQDGVLTAHLLRLLDTGTGHDDPLWQRAIAPHNRWITGNDLCQAVLRSHDGAWSKPELMTVGSEWWLLPNPHHRPQAPAAVVAHLLAAARGGEQGSTENWFTGRVAEVDQVVGWVTSGRQGLYVVTGSPGTGKSAVVGRVVSLSVPAERAALGDPERWEHDDPGVDSVAAHVHARGLTAARMAQLLLDQLRRLHDVAGVFDAGASNLHDLLGGLHRLADTGVRPVLVIDGLDESYSSAFDIVRDLLVPLGQVATVIVATRQVPHPDPRSPGLLDRLSTPDQRLDLDTAWAAAGARRSRRDYVIRRLTGVDERQDPVAIADHLDARSGAVPSFLVARLVTARLRAAPVDTSEPGWPDLVGTTVTALFDQELADVTEPSRRDTARALFRALSLSYGAGLPEREWRVVAAAVLDTTADAVTPDDITWFLDTLGRYVLQDGAGGQAVFRPLHREVAAAADARTVDADAVGERVLLRLMAWYDELLAEGIAPQSAHYLYFHLWLHAAAIGEVGVAQLRSFALRHPGFDEDVALAAQSVADVLRRHGDHRRALPLATEAVELNRHLVEVDPDVFRPRLAACLAVLYHCRSAASLGLEALASVEEAVELYRRLAHEDRARFGPGLAAALQLSCTALAALGRRSQALAAIDAALELRQEQAAADPDTYLVEVATCLINRTICLSDLARHDAALEAGDLAVQVMLAVWTAHPTYRRGPADAMHARAICLAEVGRHREALTAVQEALLIRRELAAEDPVTHLVDLAQSLHNQCGYQLQLGRYQDALTTITECVEHQRRRLDLHPSAVADLAGSLALQAQTLALVGRPQQALDQVTEAIELQRPLVAEWPEAHAVALAGSLDISAQILVALHRPRQALLSADESLSLREDLLATDPETFALDWCLAQNNRSSLLSDLQRPGEALLTADRALRRARACVVTQRARALPVLGLLLTNRAHCLVALDRPTDAVDAATEAVSVQEDLAWTRPVHRFELAIARAGLAEALAAAGRTAQALATATEAIAMFRTVAGEGRTTVGPDLAVALQTCARAAVEAGDLLPALTCATEAVDLTRDDEAGSLRLALALRCRADCLAALGRPQEALGDLAEAVALLRVDAADGLPAGQAELILALRRWADLAGPDEVREAFHGFTGDQRAEILLGVGDCDRLPLEARVTWLADAERSAVSRSTHADVHRVARRLRDLDPETFDAAWGPVDDHTRRWVFVDRSLLDIAAAWVCAPSHRHERDHLLAHPELLRTEADPAVAEALLAAPGEQSERLSSLRTAARASDITAVYEDLVLQELLLAFRWADWPTRRMLLDHQRQELTSPRALEMVSAELDLDDEAVLVGTVLQLAVRHLDDRLFLGLEEPHRWPELLVDTASDGPDALSLLAWLAAQLSTSPATAVPLLHLAVAGAARDGVTDEVRSDLRQARRADPGREAQWSSVLAGLGSTLPAALLLLPLLFDPLEPKEVPL